MRVLQCGCKATIGLETNGVKLQFAAVEIGASLFHSLTASKACAEGSPASGADTARAEILIIATDSEHQMMIV